MIIETDLFGIDLLEIVLFLDLLIGIGLGILFYRLYLEGEGK